MLYSLLHSIILIHPLKQTRKEPFVRYSIFFSITITHHLLGYWEQCESLVPHPTWQERRSNYRSSNWNSSQTGYRDKIRTMCDIITATKPAQAGGLLHWWVNKTLDLDTRDCWLFPVWNSYHHFKAWLTSFPNLNRLLNHDIKSPVTLIWYLIWKTCSSGIDMNMYEGLWG